MTPILIALSIWLHALGTVVLIGHYFLLSVIYLPVLEKGGGTFLSEISKRSRPWMYISLVVFMVTGIYLMFANPNGLSRKSILGWAASIGLDMKKFEADLDSDAVKKAVARDLADGEEAGVEGTPTVFINGQRYNGEYDLASIKPIIDAELKRLPGAKK